MSDMSFNSAANNDPAVQRFELLQLSYLVISLTEELQPLSSFVHEDTVQVTSLHRTDLNGLFSPSHDLIRADMSCKAKCNISTRHADYCAEDASTFICYYLSLVLTRTDRCGHLAPLQDHVLDDASIRVYVDALVLVAQQHLHAI